MVKIQQLDLIQFAPDRISFLSFVAHASCVFKKRIWVTGGRTNSYTKYNLEESYKVADVWYSYNGGKLVTFIALSACALTSVF